MSKPVFQQHFKMIQRTNLNILRKNRNVDMKFEIKAEDYNEPFSIIPSKLYNDFNRTSYRRHTLTFPIKVPTWYRRISAEKEFRRSVREVPNNANYAHMTGNQLLLALLNPASLNPHEFSEVFFCLSIHPESKKLNLEENKIIKEAVDYFYQQMTSWKIEPVTRILFSMYMLRFKNEELWELARKNFFKKIYAFEHISSTYFTEMFIMMLDKFSDRLTSEERDLLIEQLPRYLKNMQSDFIVKMFEICLGLGVVKSHKDYLFERHFFMIFWKFPGQFNLSEAARILKGLSKIEFYNIDSDFYEKDFLPVIFKKVIDCNDNKQLADILEEIENLKLANINEGFLDDWISKIQTRLLYVEKKLKIIDKAQFVSVVREDMRRYREKMEAELREREAQAASGDAKPQLAPLSAN